jgi:hypothetical protein
LYHYNVIKDRIGISGDQDDLHTFFGDCRPLMPSVRIDTNAEVIRAKYLRKREKFNSSGFYLGRTWLAVCTELYRGRGPHQYHDMEFWGDTDRSVYRPRWTLEELQRYPNFSYHSRRFVLSFSENGKHGVEVVTSLVDSDEIERYRASAVVLAGGTLGTTRLILRSLKKFGHPVPIVCNPYTYFTVLNLGMLGRKPRDRRSGLAQLTAIYCPPSHPNRTVYANFFSYRQLLTFRLLNEVPLPYREGLRALRGLIPLLGIWGVHHEDRPTPNKYCVLEKRGNNGEDYLKIQYEVEDGEARNQACHEKAFLRFFRKMGCWSIKQVHPGHGSSIHYGGTFPMGNTNQELTCDSNGRLIGTQSVYLADGSVFPYLPAKGLTFTIMANANRVGTYLAGQLK